MTQSRPKRPERGDAPFIMHLERVCRWIEMGLRFTIEFNPNGDVPFTGVITEVGLRILADGDVQLVTEHGGTMMAFGLTLANYKRVWRCWQNGTPSDAQRRAARWG